MSEGYEIGYGKPPAESRFKKGRSGNPKGRPRGTKNLKTDFLEELQETVVVREGGKTLRLSKQRAMVKTVINKSLTGDARAIATVAGMAARLTPADSSSTEIDQRSRSMKKRCGRP